ncbi:YqgQ family protein [Bacillus fonticola]|uniref:YqgQ family protein n=1 Tax=Bacillus fonticola TaxID=2728853 RepID=UPI001472BE4E|nr:YqgQ family protein [Bacillus fonticola]
MNTIYDVQVLLKQFGTILYVGERVANLELMEMEVKELYRAQIIEPHTFQSAVHILRKAIEEEKSKNDRQQGEEQKR